jgi:hypothetical protein
LKIGAGGLEVVGVELVGFEAEDIEAGWGMGRNRVER